MFKNALVSVADKTGLIEFIKPLAEKGMRVLSTGGTAQFLRENGVAVTLVSEQTGFPEVMDGRVKTLHPNIHMCLLARDHVDSDMKTLEEKQLLPIDLVVGNLYAFERALKDGLEDQQLVEFIDIGGPSFLRAAAKNFSRITSVCDPDDYQWVLSKSELTIDDRKKLAAKVFSHTSSYDSMIASSLGADISFNDFSIGGKFVDKLRYGENPQQQASWYRQLGLPGIHDAEILQGKALSYNNLLDLDAAVETLSEFEEVCCVSLKHNNPCGVAVGGDLLTAVQMSLESDPVSVFGGIVACNREVDEACAEVLSQVFIECLVAPSFSGEALNILASKKNLRVLSWPELIARGKAYKLKTISGGFLVQEEDSVSRTWSEEWRIYGETPDEKTKADILLAWQVCAHLKSNAISLVSGGQTVGLGMGQVNRVDAVAQAIERSHKFHPDKGSVVMASDAFFPFADSIDKAAEAGIKWIIQPGGSMRDKEVIEQAIKMGVNLIFTGTRHFLH